MKTKLLTAYLLLLGLSGFAQTQEDSISIVNAHWDIQKMGRGIAFYHAQFDCLYSGAQDIYMVEVKKHPIQVADHDGRDLTSQKAINDKAHAAINGTYFHMTPNGRSVCFVAKEGRVVEYTHFPSERAINGAVVLHGSRTEIIPWDTSLERAWCPDNTCTKHLRGKDIMVSGPLLLQNGREPQFRDEFHVMGKHPRSAIATKGKKTYLIVVDGRDAKRAAGVTIPELAHFLRIMKMDAALNLDGGGSSVLWLKAQMQSSGKENSNMPISATINNGILNVPSDGKERAVSNSIQVR